VVARYLANAGHEVLVLLLAEKSQIKGDAKINLDILEQLDVGKPDCDLGKEPL